MINEYSLDSITLKQRIEAMPEDCILLLEFDELKQRIEELQERVRKITYLY